MAVRSLYGASFSPVRADRSRHIFRIFTRPNALVGLSGSQEQIGRYSLMHADYPTRNRYFFNSLAGTPARVFPVANGRVVPLFGSVSISGSEYSHLPTATHVALGQSTRRFYH